MTALVPIEESTALTTAPRRTAMLRPVAAPQEVLRVQEEVRQLVAQALKEGRDYGVIPGAGDKPALLKPGAERVALAFGCYYGEPRIVEREVDHDREVKWIKRKKVWDATVRGKFTWAEDTGLSLGLYRYVVAVPVIQRETGATVGEGIGACSSMESKYIDRPRDVENTVLKMAHKRAMVAAALITFGLSDQFTQDVEDMPTDVVPSSGGAPAASVPTPAAAPQTSGTPACPKCNGAMWDNRATKTNPKAPDFKCRDKACDGAVWPPRDAKPKAKAQTVPMAASGDDEWIPVEEPTP